MLRNFEWRTMLQFCFCTTGMFKWLNNQRKDACFKTFLNHISEKPTFLAHTGEGTACGVVCLQSSHALLMQFHFKGDDDYAPFLEVTRHLGSLSPTTCRRKLPRHFSPNASGLACNKDEQILVCGILVYGDHCKMYIDVVSSDCSLALMDYHEKCAFEAVQCAASVCPFGTDFYVYRADRLTTSMCPMTIQVHVSKVAEINSKWTVEHQQTIEITGLQGLFDYSWLKSLRCYAVQPCRDTTEHHIVMVIDCKRGTELTLVLCIPGDNAKIVVDVGVDTDRITYNSEDPTSYPVVDVGGKMVVLKQNGYLSVNGVFYAYRVKPDLTYGMKKQISFNNGVLFAPGNTDTGMWMIGLDGTKYTKPNEIQAIAA